MHVRPYTDADWAEWLRMSLALFPGEPPEEIERGMRDWRVNPKAAVFIAMRDDGSPCGFVEVGERSYAEGCETSPVAYVEAWYVDADMRRQGVGRALLVAAEDWARAEGYSEIGSDALLDNVVSHEAHVRSGYAEVVRLVVFRKVL
ncbi:MAG: GNAT family N-acetyltransferase [Gemmatimonadota bacterium]|nr:GNAT family N-acetyltransferase [Gemmatimonadota bacterium]